MNPPTLRALCHLVLVALLLGAWPRSAPADTWMDITQTDFPSENRQNKIKIQPGLRQENPGHGRATLFKDGQEIWSRDFLNRDGPMQVFIANSGKYVITLDERYRIGQLPVVIYGPRGDLIREHSTDSLGLKDDVLHIKSTVSSYWWSENSISFFSPDEETFFIRLHWGKWIVLDLSTGNLLQKDQAFPTDEQRRQHTQKWEKLLPFAHQKLAQRAVLLLDSEEDKDRETGALICGQEKAKEAIPKLRHLLADNASYTSSAPTEWTTVYFVRKAAKEALEAMGEKAPGAVVEEPTGK